MFDFLGSAPIKDVTVASHHAIQVIRQWAAVAPLDDYLATNDAELTPFQVDLIRKIIEEIERHTHGSVKELSSDQRQKYVELVSSKLLEISKRALRTDAEQGKTLLSNLRSVTGL